MGLLSYLGNDDVQIDAKKYEEELRKDDPKLLHQNEHLVFAFKGRGGSGRDHHMLTSKRVLIRDKKGMTGKRIAYTSVPYHSIRAYSFETAGSVDADHELKIYARGIGRVSIDLVNDVDFVPIHRFLDSVVLRGRGAGEEAEGAFVYDDGARMSGDSTGWLDMLSSNFGQVDAKVVESQLKSSPNILLRSEKVELAFKCGRDSFVMTSHRILKIDVQGASGKRVEYFTALWPTVKGFSIETAGNILDRDSELILYLNLPNKTTRAEGFPHNSRTRMKVDFRQGQADLYAVQRFVSDKLLGPDAHSPSAHTGGGMAGKEDAGSGSLLAWAGDDNRMIDPTEANHKFHSETPLLQTVETVELAFKGRRDMILFTGKRVIFVDVKGFMGMGKKVEYTSVPWKSVTAFCVRSAGSMMDKDSEMCLWLDFDDLFNPPRPNQDSPPPPPVPRKSFLKIDFQKDKVDILMVHRYLSERVMRVSGHQLKPYTSAVSPDALHQSPPDIEKNLLDWIGNNAAAIDPEAVDEKFHVAGLLQPDEHVALAFSCGRDSLYFTNKRLFAIDTQGMTGKRKEYKSVPLDMIRSWSVESAGSFDRDMELRLWFKAFWKNKVKQDLRKGKADIFAVQSFIAHFVIGDADGGSALANARAYEAPPSGAMTEFLGYMGDAHMKDPVELTSQLRSSPALLQEDESIDAAFKCGRDMFLISTKRIIVIDKKGMTGKSVEYKSYPLMYNKAFRFESEGHLMSGPQVEVFTHDDNIKQELAKGQKDNIWAIHEVLSEKMLSNPQEKIEID